MPMNAAQMERRIEQNTEDIAAIYDILTGIGKKLSEHDARFDGIDGRLDGLSTQVEKLSSQMTEVIDILKQQRL